MATTEERLLRQVRVQDLRQRVTILLPVISVDTRGNRKLSYTESSTVWCYIETHASDIRESTGAVHILRKVLIVMRYLEDLPPAARYRVNDVVYESLGPPIDACGAHKYTYVECSAELRDQ